jgi:hypothetical protein
MGRGGSVLMGIIMVAVLFILFPIVMTSAHELQTEEATQVEAAVATGMGETSAPVVLDTALWSGASANVVSIVSDNILDTPAAGTYTAATRTLNVTGLAADDTRELILVYKVDALTDYTGMGQMVAVAPLLLFMGVLGAMVFGLYKGFSS